MAELIYSFSFSEKNSEEPTARTSYPLPEVDETGVKGEGKEDPQDSKLPSAPPDTSKC